MGEKLIYFVTFTLVLVLIGNSFAGQPLCVHEWKLDGNVDDTSGSGHSNAFLPAGQEQWSRVFQAREGRRYI